MKEVKNLKIENYEDFKKLLFSDSRERIIIDHKIYIINMIKNNKNRRFSMHYLAKIINKNHSTITYYLNIFRKNEYLKKIIIDSCKNNIDENYIDLFVDELNEPFYEYRKICRIENEKKIREEYEYFINKKIIVYFDDVKNKFISTIADEKVRYVSSSPIMAVIKLVNKFKKVLTDENQSNING